MTMLESLFTSRVRVRLLTLFLTHPAEAFYIRQITRLTGETYNNVRQELQNLAQLGLILSERRANATYYRANVEHFLFPELKRIILKTEAVGDRLREALLTLGDIQVAFIYGSTARGTEVASSDIDLMVIGKVDLDALDRAIDSIEEELGRTVNYALFDVEEWRERVHQRHSFAVDVLTHKKVFLIGDEDDLPLGASGTEGNCGLRIADLHRPSTHKSQI
jgi:predicted nucleotidyltransferase/predicted transcriptional regulator with HTH domain